jgi:NTP pyrophosphatase (non-canonical NTP hydrolase)
MKTNITIEGIDIPLYKKYPGIFKQLRHVKSELDEVFEAMLLGNKTDLQDEIADVLLSAVTLFCHSIVDPKEREATIRRVIQKNQDRGYYETNQTTTRD